MDDGADIETVRAALAGAAGGATIQTVPEIAEQRTAQETGSNVTFLVIMLAFAAVALAVASLVITNTFQVLVAQRTRTLALLRCVGASRGQIRRSVLGEAAVLGLLASIVGSRARHRGRRPRGPCARGRVPRRRAGHHACRSRRTSRS